MKKQKSIEDKKISSFSVNEINHCIAEGWVNGLYRKMLAAKPKTAPQQINTNQK